MSKKRIGFLVVSLLSLSVLVCCAYVFHFQQAQEVVSTENVREYAFTVIEDEKLSSFGSSCVAKASLSNGDEVKVVLYFPPDSETVSYGKTIKSTTKISNPSKGLTEQQKIKGIVGVAYLQTFSFSGETNMVLSFVSDLRNYAINLLGANEAESGLLLNALLTGDKTNLYDSSLYQNVKTCGLAHLVAVSGAHLVIVSSFISFLLNKTALNRFIKIFIQIVVLILYLFFVGFPVSCLRATVMASLSLAASLFMRRSSALSALGIIVMIFIALDPGIVRSLSFSLSVLATLGIVLFMPLLLSCFKRRGVIVETFSMTIAATFLTFPLSASVFSQVSLISPLSNLVAVPFLSFLCIGGIISLTLSFIPFLGSFCMGILNAVADVFCKCIEALSQVPFASIPVSVDVYYATVVVALVSVFLWLFWSKITIKSLSILSAFACLLFIIPFIFVPNNTEIVMFDVGQGDSFLVRSEGKNILIDTGNNSSKLLKGMAEKRVQSIDALFITHPDDDHCGLVEELSRVVAIKKVFLAKGICQSMDENPLELVNELKKSKLDSSITEVSVGDIVSFGDIQMKVLSPRKIVDGGNEDSICLLLSFLSSNNQTYATALFTGDAEKEVLQKLVKEYGLQDITILKIAHHGSRNSINEELIEVLRPEIALVSVGERNNYGHPNQEVVSNLEKEGTSVFRTDKNGTVVCTMNQDNIEVVSEK